MYKTISIEKDYLIEEASKDKEKKQNDLKKLEKNYRSYQKKIFGGYLFDEHFTDNLSVWFNEDCIKCVTLSYQEFIYKLQRILNVDEISFKDDNKLTSELLKRLEILRGANSLYYLKQHFPMIADIYNNGQKQYNMCEAQKSFAMCGEYDKELLHDCIAFEKYYENCGLTNNLKKFIQNQSNILENMIKKRRLLLDFTKSRDNVIYNSEFEPLKLKGIFFNKLLSNELITKSVDDEIVIETLLNKYIGNDDNKPTVFCDQNGNKVTFIDLLKKARLYLSRDSKECLVPWEINKSGVDDSKSISSGKKRKFKDNHLEKLTGAIKSKERKCLFYQGTDFKALAEGTSAYSGYVAFIYPNGKIVTDTIPDEDNLKKSVDNAIFIFDVSNFEALSLLTKQELKRHPDVIKMNHSKTWEQRVRKIIEELATEEVEEKVDELILRLKK